MMQVFLSHSYDDKNVAQKVRNYLVHQDIDVFDDRNDISTGESLSSSINEAINRSDAVLFLISKHAEKSRWVNQEMSIAVSNRFKGKETRLIPIVIDKHAEIPFFLKDYVYLDMSGGSSFDEAMERLLLGLKKEPTSSPEQDLAAKISNIEMERELLQLKSLEHAEFQKFKSRQMFFVTIIATLVSAMAASFGLLGWLAKIDYSNFEWLISFFLGALASLAGSFLYMRKEQPHKEELIKKIDSLHESLRQKGINNDNK